MLYGVEADSGLTLQCLGSRALKVRAFCWLASAFLGLVINFSPFLDFTGKVRKIIVFSGLQVHCLYGRAFQECRSGLRFRAYYHEYSERVAEKLVVPLPSIP